MAGLLVSVRDDGPGIEDHRLEVGDVVEVRALERPIRFLEPAGAMPFWDLLRTKVALLPS